MSSTNALIGFADIAEKDQLFLKNLIASENLSRKKIPAASTQKPKAKVKPDAPLHVRKAKLKPSSADYLKVLYTNADQLTTTKMTELRLRIQQEKPMIIAVCEVKPKNTLRRHDYAIPGYSLHPVNLDNSVGRGIAVYTHSSLDQSIVQIKSDLSFQEACLLEIKLRGGDLMLFGCFYRSPTTCATSDKNNTDLNRLLTSISKNNYSHRCTVGDFNFKDINWSTWSTPRNEESKEQRFIETARSCFFHQHNQENSRRRGNDAPSLIDLIFTDEAMQVSDVHHQSPLGRSDHDVIRFSFNCYLDYSKPQEKFIYSKADFVAMRNRLAEEGWCEDFITSAGNKSIEQLWESLKTMLMKMRSEFVPKKLCSSTPQWKDIGGFPIDQGTKNAIKEKQATHRQWIASQRRGDPVLARSRFRKASNKAKKLIRQCKRRYELSIAELSKTNPKLFFAHVRGRLKTKEGVAPLLEDPTNKSSMKFLDGEKANILQEQFSSVYTSEPDSEAPFMSRRTTATIDNILVTAEMVEEEISKTKIDKSCGPDEIHPKMLKELVSSIALPISILLNRTIQEGKIPQDWKTGSVPSTRRDQRVSLKITGPLV